MEWQMQFPILSVIIFTPLVAGILILLYPAERKDAVKITALTAMILSFLLSLWAFISYDTTVAGYQFIEKLNWLPKLGISYHVGVDGFSVPMILLTGIVALTGVMISWRIDDRPREFFAFLCFLASSVFGVFASLDLFMLFFFLEIAVFTKYLLIAVWGWPKTREYGSMKLTLYLFIGSIVALVGALAIYFTAGKNTFDLLLLEQAGFPLEFQRLWFPFVFIGFGVLGGLFPFHSWAPDGHVAAPTAISMLLAGVEMKVGAFAALRVGIMLLPDGAHIWAPLIIGLALVNVVYGALIALVQSDFKYVIGFSSVSHMGLVMLGFATFSKDGLTGAGMQMFSHGVMTAMFFAIVGMVYDRAHTRELSQLGGMFKIMPFAGVGFVIAGLVSMGMPGFSGFAAEFPIFMGLWRSAPYAAVIAILGVIITAAYILRVINRVFFGQVPAELEGHLSDVSVLDKLTIVLLAVFMIAFGVFPSMISNVVGSGVTHILTLVGGA
ncbi:MAG: NADH-quinone oxidoreductase subunit M [Methanothrix sp.]|nr:MAG: NADH-quinone oxidoreductase subunit M [Methanothrix sp.]